MFPTFTEFVLNRCIQLEIKRGGKQSAQDFCKTWNKYLTDPFKVQEWKGSFIDKFLHVFYFETVQKKISSPVIYNISL